MFHKHTLRWMLHHVEQRQLVARYCTRLVRISITTVCIISYRCTSTQYIRITSQTNPLFIGNWSSHYETSFTIRMSLPKAIVENRNFCIECRKANRSPYQGNYCISCMKSRNQDLIRQMAPEAGFQGEFPVRGIMIMGTHLWDTLDYPGCCPKLAVPPVISFRDPRTTRSNYPRLWFPRQKSGGKW